MSPAQTGKAGIVPVCRNPFYTGFNSKGSQIGIGDEVSLCIHLLAQAAEDIPVPFNPVQVSPRWG